VLAFVEIKCNLRNKRETLHTSEEFSFFYYRQDPVLEIGTRPGGYVK
jgi:hypothetical protein